MPRDVPLGNGRLLLCFDSDFSIRDLYFPHVGQENHLSGNACRMGVLADSTFSWIGDGWRKELIYEEDTLVARADLYHWGMGLLITCLGVVDFHENVHVREILVENLRPERRQVRLFFSHDFDISGNSIGDTAAFDPATHGIVHYKGNRYFLVNGMTDESETLSQYAVGVKGVGGREGTFRDAEDGHLSGNPIAQGSVDSVIGLHLELEAHSSGSAFYWICAGENWEAVRHLDTLVRHKHPRALIKRTADFWALWVRKEPLPDGHLSGRIQEQYRRSLLILSTQLDWRGGILAGNDSDVIQYNRDTYSYVWPRDGALVANALDLAGYPADARRFYEFAASVLDEEGYFLHKYNPDGSLASSWHPWVEGGERQLPIQEDETALVLWALWQHFVLYRDIDFIKPLYRSLVKRAADFMVSYRDIETGLPGPSYDLWEERRGILSFTVAAVFGGLTAASLFCEVFGEHDQARIYRKAASQVRDGASNHLWRADLGRFCRMISRGRDGSLQVDGTCDSSLWGLFTFGVYKPDDPRITATVAALREKLWVGGATGGMARYENDDYHRAGREVTGNPWFISTLWLADHLVATARTLDDLRGAEELLEWACRHTLPSGVLAEQLHPHTGQPLSVSPLTWSHATFVATTQRFILRVAEIESEVTPPRRDDWIGRLFAETCSAIHGSCKVN